ncbi:MAG: hypothetical protein RLZZ225_1061, partial [Pseudomonadota bacterium]
LQEKLAPFFKKKVFLLFHPDKYDSANGPIKKILDALFIQIKNFYETSVTQLLEGIEIIQQSNDEKEDHEQILQAYRELYRVFLKDFTAVYEKYEQKVTAMYKEMEEQMKAHHADIKAHHAEVQMYHAEVQMHHAGVQMYHDEVQMYHDDIKAHHAEVQMHYAKAEAKMQEWERQFMARMALPQNQATASDASDNETAAATGYSFFPAGR